MLRKREGYVALGDVAGAVKPPGDRALPPRSDPLQVRSHFTMRDQVTQLVGASETDADLGFMARLLALCSLPRSNPGSQIRYIRHNGPYTLAMTAGVNTRLPYGTLPRLLLAWVCTEAVRTQSRELVLGRSLYEFMRKLGMEDRSGGVHGERTRLRNQMTRLFGCSVTLIYENASGFARVSSFVADKHEFWWDTKRPDEPSLWESKIHLGEQFFQEIIAHPIPLDMNILRAIKRSPLGLDLYLWLTYRTFALKRPLQLSWRQLYRQFGADLAKAGDKATLSNFRAKCLRELKKIKMAWPDLHYSTPKGVLLLLPSPPRISPSQLSLVEEQLSRAVSATGLARGHANAGRPNFPLRPLAGTLQPASAPRGGGGGNFHKTL